MRQSYDSCLVICHGKSELIFVQNLRSNLKIKFATYARNNGNKNIQITSLSTVLKSGNFKTLRAFKDKYSLNPNKEELKKFKVFIIMDFDELEYTEEIKRNYLNKSMFKDHFLYEYIEPIYNIKNFDDVMIKAGYSIDINCKRKSYEKIFPGKNGSFNDFIKVKNKLKKVPEKDSNINLLLDHLLEQYNNKVKY